MSNDQFKDAFENAQDYQPKPEMEMVCMSDIETRGVRWMWYRRLALGKLSVIAGNPGLGKSQITAYLAAVVTGGANWPDGALRPQIGSVIFLSAEDDAADTIKPRLLAAGADVRKCYVFGSNVGQESAWG